MKKKFLIMLMISVISISLFGCVGKGDVSNVERKITASNQLLEADANAAMDVVEEYFAEKFNGCVLQELSFDEKRCKDRVKSEKKTKWLGLDYSEGNVIFLDSVFVVKRNVPGLVAGDVHYYDWTLAREDGEWVIKSYGYA